MTYVCPRCQGSGTLIAPVIDGEPDETMHATCPQCYGTGEVKPPENLPPADVRCRKTVRRACAIDGYCDVCPLAPRNESDKS